MTIVFHTRRMAVFGGPRGTRTINRGNQLCFRLAFADGSFLRPLAVNQYPP